MPTKTYYADGRQLKNLPLTDPAPWIDAGFGDWFNASPSNITAASSYSLVGWLNRCVNIRATAMTSLPWALYRGDEVLATNAAAVPDAMPWLQVLPLMLGRTEAAMPIVSSAYWYKIRNRGKGIAELRWFAPDTMTPKWDKSAGLVAFERRLGSEKIVIAPDDIVYFSLPSPLHETEPGPSPVKTALTDIGVLHAYGLFAKSYFERGAIKPMLITTETKLPRSEEEKITSWWNRVFGGITQAFSTEVVAPGVKPEIIGEGLSELSSRELSSERREAISTALGVPHSLVMSNAANYATAEADRLNFYDTTVLPSARVIEQALNEQLFEPLGYRLRFTPESMALYQENEEERAQAFAQYVNAGMLPSVAAQILGITLPEGVEYEDLDPEPQPVIINAAPEPAPDEDDDEGDGLEEAQDDAEDTQKRVQWETEAGQFRKWLKRTKGRRHRIDEFSADHLTHDDKLAIVADVAGTKATRMDDERNDLEERHTANIARTFRRLRRIVIPAGTTADSITADEAVQRLRDNRQLLEDAIVQMLRDAVLLGAEDGQALIEEAQGVRKQVNVSIAWDKIAEAALAWISGPADGFGTGYDDEIVTALMATSERQVRDEVTRWIADRTPLRDLTAALDRTVFSETRAEMIAQTEATRAFAEGNRVAFRESGLVQRIRWNTARDELVCPVCGPLDRQTAPIDGEFDGGYFPPAHPRCRCDISPVIEVP